MNEDQTRLPAPRATGSPGASEGWAGSFGSPAPRTVANARALEPRRDGEGSLAHVVETLLDKGLVLNADIMVSVAGVELLGIRLRAALASFETASRYGLEFPAGTDTDTAAWREAKEEKEACPQCDKKVPTKQLLDEWCPWCGWRSAQALSRAATDTGEGDGEPGELEQQRPAGVSEERARRNPARKAATWKTGTARRRTSAPRKATARKEAPRKTAEARETTETKEEETE
ncbi:gas vesicle protein [Streptomyces sp. NPDC056600]|uniref:gas vesicle protein n=1 Tax=Streptomyces sp. NPDC056600 TaxID=3345874 RepID=UPI0036784C62